MGRLKLAKHPGTKAILLSSLLVAAVTLHADIVQNLSATAPESCGGFFCTGTFSMQAQQFDPSLGTLLSVSGFLTDNQSSKWEVVGIPQVASADVNCSVSSSDLSLTATGNAPLLLCITASAAKSLF